MRALKQFLRQKKGYCGRQDCKCLLISTWRDYQAHPEFCDCGDENNTTAQETLNIAKSSTPETVVNEDEDATPVVEAIEEVSEENGAEPTILDLNELNS